MIQGKILIRSATLILFLGLSSCFKDVDVDQVKDIEISPTAALDLIYFTIDANHFVEQENILKAADETRLDFLDDDYIQDGLVRADFNFQYVNTFEEEVRSVIHFISKSGEVMYTIAFNVPGAGATPGTINYTEIIKEEQIETIKRSIKIRVELEMLSGAQSSTGELQLKSRGFYFFEF